jgi:hypothetical protein
MNLMRLSALFLAIFLGIGAHSANALADEEGEFKRAGQEIGKAATTVGKQVGSGTGKAVKGVSQKIESETRRAKDGKPPAKRSNTSTRTEKQGRS